jgi:hypothetical protein
MNRETEKPDRSYADTQALAPLLALRCPPEVTT